MGADILVELDVVVRPTEDLELVLKAVNNIFPNAQLDVSEESITGSADDIDGFLTPLQEMSLMDSARGHLISRIHAGRCTFELSKDAALAGRVNFATGLSPAMGTIRVKLTGDDLEGTLSELMGVTE